MAGIKELRGRITSISNIQQITRAMEMVATTKLRRFQDRAVSSRPYTEEVAGLVGRLAAVLGDSVADRPLFNAGGGDRTLCLLVTSDRGLCGAYNSNLLRFMEQWKDELGREADFFVYGRKGATYLKKRGHTMARFLTEPKLESIDFTSAAITARMLTQEFLSGKYRDVVLMFSAFESMARYQPTAAPFLPISADALGAEEVAGGSGVILEPDAESIFDNLIPRYLETRVYNTLVESLTSEYASRRFAMKNATDAANDMQKVLKGVYNRKRQEGITTDLLDIVGGAEALR
ncbi:MAG: ATP synthase F1 subunit gamma [Planctomycetes bacterium]|nr:ATP synthase F1 subunit gamma [Planctomycetota bacterium]